MLAKYYCHYILNLKDPMLPNHDKKSNNVYKMDEVYYF